MSSLFGWLHCEQPLLLLTNTDAAVARTQFDVAELLVVLFIVVVAAAGVAVRMLNMLTTVLLKSAIIPFL